jgi:hypothetical protein
MEQQWIPSCLEHPHTFLSTLYIASAHLDVVHKREAEGLETAALKQELVHLIGTNLTHHDDSVANHNIIAVVQLIAGEVISRAEAGVETMIKQRGGLNEPGQILPSMVSSISLASAILREARARPIYYEYCQARSLKTYTLMMVIPESPLYYPRGKYVTLERYRLPRSGNCKPDMLKLLNDIRIMIGLLLSLNKVDVSYRMLCLVFRTLC